MIILAYPLLRLHSFSSTPVNTWLAEALQLRPCIPSTFEWRLEVGPTWFTDSHGLSFFKLIVEGISWFADSLILFLICAIVLAFVRVLFLAHRYLVQEFPECVGVLRLWICCSLLLCLFILGLWWVTVGYGSGCATAHRRLAGSCRPPGSRSGGFGSSHATVDVLVLVGFASSQRGSVTRLAIRQCGLPGKRLNSSSFAEPLRVSVHRCSPDSLLRGGAHQALPAPFEGRPSSRQVLACVAQIVSGIPPAERLLLDLLRHPRRRLPQRLFRKTARYRALSLLQQVIK